MHRARAARPRGSKGTATGSHHDRFQTFLKNISNRVNCDRKSYGAIFTDRAATGSGNLKNSMSTPFQSQRGPIKSRLWTTTIRRRRSRRCDLACRTSPGAFWGLRYRRWGVGHLGLAACPVKLLQGGRPTHARTQHAHHARIGSSGNKTGP
jgi:hypothetical protein